MKRIIKSGKPAKKSPPRKAAKTTGKASGAKPMFERVAIIGVGLIGSSLARVIKRDKLAGAVVGCARTPETCKAVLDLGLADAVTSDPAAAVRDADLVMICAPVGALGQVNRESRGNRACGKEVRTIRKERTTLVRGC